MGDNRDSHLVKALLDNYEEPFDISFNSLQLIKIMSNDSFFRKLLQTYTKLNNKTPAKSKSIQELESFTDQKCKEQALGSLKRDCEIKQQISQELEAHYNTSLEKI